LPDSFKEYNWTFVGAALAEVMQKCEEKRIRVDFDVNRTVFKSHQNQLICAIKGDERFVGTKLDILQSIGSIAFNGKGEITFKARYYNLRTYNSYSDEWSQEEKWKDAIDVVFRSIEDFGYRIYKCSEP
jgi:hypothetical protein